MHLFRNMQNTKECYTKVAPIFLMAALILSVATMSIAPRTIEATTLSSDYCEGFGILCEGPPPPPPGEEPPTTDPLTVEIISNDTEGEDVAPATFEFDATIAGGTEPYTFSWNFGDDSAGSDEQNVVHTFNEAGTYTVTLTVTDSEDQTASDTLEITVEEGEGPPPEESPPALSSSVKFFLALFLQYVNRDAQVNIYQPNMNSEDFTRLRVQNGDQLKSDYITAARSLPGPSAVAFMSSQEIVENAQRVKNLGFGAIEFNLESGLSPSSDNNNVVSAMRRAADAAHDQGLKFRATPSRSYTTQYGSQIAPFVDYYHIQAQSLQDNGIKAYSDYVHAQVAKLEKANPNLLISVQVSTQQGNAPGLSKLETMKQCVSAVMDVADGASVWFGGGDLSILRSFVEWYDDRWS